MKEEFILDYSVLAVERAQHVYVLARVHADAGPKQPERRPLNLSVVLDRSGSMQGNKLEYVKQAVQVLVQRLAAQDRFSVVSYNQLVTVDVPPLSAVEKDPINRAIKKLQSRGNTNLSGGWLQGCQLVEEGMVDGHINRVLLLTDGLANEGVTDPARLEALARQKNSEGVTTTTLGVGLDFNEDLLLRMAKEGGGAFYFIDNPDQAPTIFLEELHLLMSVVGQNLSITLTPAPEIALVRQWSGYASERAGSGMRFRMGDLYAEESKALLLELSIPALKSTGEVEIARLNFEYDELGEDSVTHRRIELPVQVKVVAAEDFASQERHPEVVKMALLMHSARAREEAIQLADVGNFAQAGQVLRQAADLIRDSQIEDPELRQQHDMLREEAVDMDLGAQRYTAYERKSHTSKLFTGGTRPFDLMATGQLHQRMKSERQAIERHGTTPTLIMWPGQAQPLSDHTRFGRAADNDIVINEDAVSAHHCEIVRSGSDFVLRDLNSRNGTFANGGRVSGEFRLSIGDVMTVGSVLFMFEGAA